MAGIKRPFSVRFDPYTSSVEVLDNPLKIQGGLDGVKDELKMLTDALSVLSWCCPSLWPSCCCLLPLPLRSATSDVWQNQCVNLSVLYLQYDVSNEFVACWRWLVGRQGCNHQNLYTQCRQSFQRRLTPCWRWWGFTNWAIHAFNASVLFEKYVEMNQNQRELW